MTTRIEQMDSFHKSRHKETAVKKDHTGALALKTPLNYGQQMRMWSTMKEQKDPHDGIFQLDPRKWADVRQVSIT